MKDIFSKGEARKKCQMAKGSMNTDLDGGEEAGWGVGSGGEGIERGQLSLEMALLLNGLKAKWKSAGDNE